jgi:HSP20 family molecular chaperone IbpA
MATLPLPVAVQSKYANVQCKDGVLEITMPKAEQAMVKRMPIQTP